MFPFSACARITQKTKYFRTFKVDYLRDCQFWDSEYLCSAEDGEQGACHVSECDDAEIPVCLKAEATKPRPTNMWGRAVVEQGGMTWDECNADEWCICDNGPGAVYIDLLKNPESFTGYSGNDASRVWLALYNENCFGSVDDIADQCFENRVFYRLISGFHAATTVSIAKSSGPNNGPNLDLFKWRLAKFPERLKNIHFVYLFLLDTMNKARDIVLANDIAVGDPVEDEFVARRLDDLFALPEVQECQGSFDSQALTAVPQLGEQYRQKWVNVSRVVDCTGCDKCKIHAKLQLLGIGTALKIQFGGPSTTIRHNEAIALINTLQKYADAVQTVDEMMALLNEREAAPAPDDIPEPAPPVSGEECSVFTWGAWLAGVWAALADVQALVDTNTAMGLGIGTVSLAIVVSAMVYSCCRYTGKR